MWFSQFQGDDEPDRDDDQHDNRNDSPFYDMGRNEGGCASG